MRFNLSRADESARGSALGFNARGKSYVAGGRYGVYFPQNRSIGGGLRERNIEVGGPWIAVVVRNCVSSRRGQVYPGDQKSFFRGLITAENAELLRSTLGLPAYVDRAETDGCQVSNFCEWTWKKNRKSFLYDTRRQFEQYRRKDEQS